MSHTSQTTMISTIVGLNISIKDYNGSIICLNMSIKSRNVSIIKLLWVNFYWYRVSNHILVSHMLNSCQTITDQTNKRWALWIKHCNWNLRDMELLKGISYLSFPCFIFQLSLGFSTCHIWILFELANTKYVTFETQWNRDFATFLYQYLMNPRKNKWNQHKRDQILFHDNNESRASHPSSLPLFTIVNT